MSKRNRREHGRIISVETMVRGDALALDAAAGATTITVNDAGDFDEDGGWLYIGAQTIEYTACDDDTGVITLVDPLTAAGEEGDSVQVWSDLYDEVVNYQLALVELDGEYDNPDPVVAEVGEGVGELPEGDRGKAGESCTLKRVADDEWEVVGVGGRPRAATGTLFYQDSFDVTAAGEQALALTYTPVKNSEHLYWLPGGKGGLYVPGSKWSRNENVLTVPDPTSKLAVGDKLVCEYAYRKGVKTPLVARDPVPPLFVASNSVVSNASSLAYAAGTVAGDLVILGMISGWDSNEVCTDSRMTSVADVFIGSRHMRVYAGQASNLATPLAININETSGATSEMAMATVTTWRGPASDQLLWKPGAVATASGGDTTQQMPGLPDTDLSGAICVFLTAGGIGGVYGDQDWSKAPAYSLKVAADDAYIEIDFALTTTVPVPAQTTVNIDTNSAWAAVVIGVQ